MSVTVTSTSVNVDVTTSPVTVTTGTLSTVWGYITGDIANQTDLQTLLGGYVTPSSVTTFTNKTLNLTSNTLIATSAQLRTAVTDETGTGSLVFSTNPTLDAVTWTTTPATAAGECVARWNDTDGTLDLGLKGGNVTLQIGQETVQRVFNNSGVNLVDGDIVYISGSSGQRLTVAKANANSGTTSIGVLGMVTENILNGAEGFVTVEGMVRNVNTSGYADGTPLYLSATTSGAYTSTVPNLPNYQILIGYVVKGNSAGGGSVFVRVDNLTNSTVGTVLTYAAKTTDYTLTGSDSVVNCTDGPATITLPTAVGNTGRVYNIKNSGTGEITVATTSSQTIDGELTKILSIGDNIQVISTGANWIVL